MTPSQAILSAPLTPPGAHLVPGQSEGFVSLDGREHYAIPGFDQLAPFLVSVVSESDLWLYVSSRGGLTAGRRGPDQALFAYETDDRLHHLHGITGPITLVRPAPDAGEDDPDHAAAWEPFAGVPTGDAIRRRLLKTSIGNSLVFEEDHLDRELTFRYRWETSDAFGLVRTATLVNRSPHETRVLDLVDGLLNLQPAGIPLGVQQGSSCLADAYKYCELDRESRLAIYSLSSLVSDRAEPAESLRASVAWCRGLPGYRVLLSDRQLRAFRLGQRVGGESRLRGQRGAFLVAARLELRPGQALSWNIVADTARTQAQVARLRRFLIEEPNPQRAVRQAVDAGGTALAGIVAAHDGLQASADRSAAVHHFANVLFNTMRGGAMADGGRIGRDDFARFVNIHNPPAAETHAGWLRALPDAMAPETLRSSAESTGDPVLVRLALEYLPLTFGRRHGDPSRPWNRFEIRVKDPAGRPVLAYQGNWRDIFQNWEALCLSYPAYLPGVIAKFVNASTADGFNPYRLSEAGIDWEAPEPGNPWSNFGYWGDHQVVYLTRLIEACRRHEPHWLASMLGRRVFTYADVPYRLRPYRSLVENCRDTIDFDHDRETAIRAREATSGSDARLLHDAGGGVRHVTLVEKLLVPVLAKLSNLVRDGGIWMNTQRPEWNDANNALAGHGVSVVTLCYLHRHVALLADLLRESGETAFEVSGAVVAWLKDVTTALQSSDAAPRDAAARRRVLDALGDAFCRYRGRVYAGRFGDTVAVPPEHLLALLDAARSEIERSIRANRRPDGLFHAYNLLALDNDTATIERLPEMLEGQVAALSCGLLSADEAVALLDALFESDLYCPRRRTFTLYPDRPTAGFLERNLIPAGRADSVTLLEAMGAARDERIVARDDDGTCRFAPGLRNAGDLAAVLDALEREPRFAAAAAADRRHVLDLYESVFRHHAFTGRSGSMFGYEGLGCVYWHMVAKLMVAVQELWFDARRHGHPAAERLAEAYWRVRDGLGFNQSASEYGAFPTDPYSHTPSHSGVRQPGMTGQVKEEIITRRGELGVQVTDGRIAFEPGLLSRHEFAAEAARLDYVDLAGTPQHLDLPAGALAFTLCQVPVVYRLDPAGPRVLVARGNGHYDVTEGTTLDVATSASVFARDGSVLRIEVSVHEGALRDRRATFPRFQSQPPETMPDVPAEENSGGVSV